MIDFTRSYTFDAPPERVWKLLMDTDALAGCIPGCESLEPEGENRYVIKLSVKMAAVMGHYDGTVTLSELDPPRSYHMQVAGRGRPGFVTGDASITLSGDGPSTEVTVNGRVQPGGAIARVGQRLIGSAATFMIDGFFKRMTTLAAGESPS